MMMPIINKFLNRLYVIFRDINNRLFFINVKGEYRKRVFFTAFAFFAVWIPAFSTAVCKRALQHVGYFFEKIFLFAREIQNDTPIVSFITNNILKVNDKYVKR